MFHLVVVIVFALLLIVTCGMSISTVVEANKTADSSQMSRNHATLILDAIVIVIAVAWVGVLLFLRYNPYAAAAMTARDALSSR